MHITKFINLYLADKSITDEVIRFDIFDEYVRICTGKVPFSDHTAMKETESEVKVPQL